MPAPTMSSLELVDFINSFGVGEGRERSLRHDNFMKKVPNVLGKDAAPKFLGVARFTNGTGGQVSRPVYNFPKREACLMAMSYSYELQATPAPFAIPTTLGAALRLAAVGTSRAI